MQCNEIRERFVDLLYEEKGTPSAGPELRDHLRICASCQQELAELKSLQATLKVWKDEPPIRSVAIPRAEPAYRRMRFPVWNALRYAAIAALVTLAFLGISNADIRWDQNGFSFRTSLLPKAATKTLPAPDYYTKEEVLEVVQRVADDSRAYNLMMIQSAMKIMEQENGADLRYVTAKLKESRTKN